MTTTTDPTPEMILDISGTFDIARARNRLRQLVDKYRLPLMLRARSAATLTTLAELVLFKSTNTGDNKLQLTVRILDEEVSTQGLEFSFFAPFTSDIAKNFAVAEWQLERSCDELGICNQGDSDFIIMRLWSRRSRRA